MKYTKKFTAKSVKNKRENMRENKRENKKNSPTGAFVTYRTIMNSELYNTELLYRINLDKLKDGCKKNWFGSADTTYGLSPCDIIIDETEPIHFVQILFNLKEICYQDDNWMLFSRNGLISIMKNQESNYLQDTRWWGKSFTNEFHSQIDFFIKMFCEVAGYY